MGIVRVLTVCAVSLLASVAAPLPTHPYERAILCQALSDIVQADDARALEAGRAIAFALEEFVKSGKKRRSKILSDISGAAMKMDKLDATVRHATWTQCLDAYAPAA